MDIHLPAILMFTRGTRFWHCHFSKRPTNPKISKTLLRNMSRHVKNLLLVGFAMCSTGWFCHRRILLDSTTKCPIICYPTLWQWQGEHVEWRAQLEGDLFPLVILWPETTSNWKVKLIVAPVPIRVACSLSSWPTSPDKPWTQDGDGCGILSKFVKYNIVDNLVNPMP